MQDKDCYIFLDMDTEVQEEQRKPKFLCIPCRNEIRPGEGWAWEATSGYGPWDFKCHRCGTYLHKHDEGENGED